MSGRSRGHGPAARWLAALRLHGTSARLLAAEAAREFVNARAALDRQFPVRQATLDDYLAHLLHALKVVGVDHVGIGADWDGGGGVEGLRDVSALPRITERLLAEAYSTADVEKIWSGNVLRVLREAERVRDSQAGKSP